MNKRLLTAGCSFTKDNYQKTWADYLADKIEYDLTNIAARGAGIDFVTTRILHECLRQPYDLIVIMLSSVDRMDLYVDSQHPLKNEFLDITSWQDGDDRAYEFLWANIDWKNFIFDQATNGFLIFVKNNQYKIIKNHPETAAHSAWVKQILLPNLSI
jgi:hypothetical protein